MLEANAVLHGSVNGWFGYCFSDFGDEFEYATEVFVPVPQQHEQSQGSTALDDEDVVLSDDDEPHVKRHRMSGAGDASAGASAAAAQATTEKQPESQEKKREKVIVRKRASFTPLANAFNNPGSQQDSGDVKRKRQKAPYPVGFYLFQIMAGFRYQSKRSPRLSSKSQDTATLRLERNAVLNTLGDIKIDIPENFASSMFEQVPAVCAIIGGVLSQEAIKAVSQKDEPMNNWFFYNPFDSSGVVGKIPRH